MQDCKISSVTITVDYNNSDPLPYMEQVSSSLLASHCSLHFQASVICNVADGSTVTELGLVATLNMEEGVISEYLQGDPSLFAATFTGVTPFSAPSFFWADVLL